MSAVKKDYSELLPLLRYVLLCIYGNKYNLNKSPFKNVKMLLLFLKGFDNGILIKDYKVNAMYITQIRKELKNSRVNIQKLKWSLERECFLNYVKNVFPALKLDDFLINEEKFNKTYIISEADKESYTKKLWKIIKYLRNILKENIIPYFLLTFFVLLYIFSYLYNEEDSSILNDNVENEDIKNEDNIKGNKDLDGFSESENESMWSDDDYSSNEKEYDDLNSSRTEGKDEKWETSSTSSNSSTSSHSSWFAWLKEKYDRYKAESVSSFDLKDLFKENESAENKDSVRDENKDKNNSLKENEDSFIYEELFSNNKNENENEKSRDEESLKKDKFTCQNELHDEFTDSNKDLSEIYEFYSDSSSDTTEGKKSESSSTSIETAIKTNSYDKGVQVDWVSSNSKDKGVQVDEVKDSKGDAVQKGNTVQTEKVFINKGVQTENVLVKNDNVVIKTENVEVKHENVVVNKDMGVQTNELKDSVKNYKDNSSQTKVDTTKDINADWMESEDYYIENLFKDEGKTGTTSNLGKKDNSNPGKRFYSTKVDRISYKNFHTNQILSINKDNNKSNQLLNTNTSSYNAIQDVINDPSINLLNKQIKIEEILKNKLKLEIYDTITKKRNLDVNKIGMGVIFRQLTLLEEDVKMLMMRGSMKNKGYMEIIKHADASLIISVIISKIIPFTLKYKDIDTQPITKLILDVGKAILNEIAYNLYIKDLKDKVISEEVKLKDYIKEKDLSLEDDELAKFGLDFIHFIGSRSNFVELKESYVGKELYRRYLVPKEDLTVLLENYSFIDTEELPMLIKPFPWIIKDGKIIEYGGTYLNNKYQFKSIISNTYKNPICQDMLLNQNLIDTVNKLSSTPFIINDKVFKILTEKEYYINGNKKLINFRAHEESNLLSRYMDEENLMKVNEIVSFNSKYLYETSLLNIAKLMLNVNEFYLTTFLDWRCRFYNSNSLLNMQGSELARALILFSKGYILDENGVRALKVYTANAFGLDKKSKKDRVNWVDKHLNEIIDTPNNNLWLSANEPILFLACALELKEYNKDPKFISKLPILLDATCNGLQHLSAIANDINLAERVNISSSTEEDGPNDIYSDLVQPIRDSIKTLVEKDTKHYNLLRLNITRKLIKRGIMTITYGVTVKGIFDQLISDHFYKFGKIDKHLVYRPKNSDLGDVNLTYADLYKLSSIIYSVLFKSHPILNNIMEYFHNMVNLMNKLDLSIQWITPYGLLITQKYTEFTTYDIVSVMQRKRRKITLSRYRLDDNKHHVIDKDKQINSFIPNFIHSMDASNIVLLVKKIIELDLNIITIHDCFGIHANHAELLSYLVKESFISMYGNKDSIEKFHSLTLENIKANYIIDNSKNVIIDKNGKEISIPEKPNLGNMDLKEVLINSKYFIN